MNTATSPNGRESAGPIPHLDRTPYGKDEVK